MPESKINKQHYLHRRGNSTNYADNFKISQEFLTGLASIENEHLFKYFELIEAESNALQLNTKKR
jgi:hypothetical protein